MKKAAILVALAIPLVLFTACKTKPKPPEEPLEREAPAKPAEKPLTAGDPTVALAKPQQPAAPGRPQEPPTAGVVARPVAQALAKPKEKAAPVSEADVQRARDALARAKAADAAYYEAELYRSASGDLDAGLRSRQADPDQCRSLLASATDKADRAYSGSVRKAAADLEGRWKAMDAKLRGIDADKFAATAYRDIVAKWEKAKAAYASAAGDVATAKALAYEGLKAQTDLYDALNGRLGSIDRLRKDVGAYLDEAERAEADKWAPKELAETNRLYLLGVEAFQSFKLDETEEYYGAAREAARHAAAVARQNRAQTEEQKRAEAARLMKEVMGDLEAASKMTVVTDDGTVILPEEWSGEDLMRELEKPQTKSTTPGSQSLLIPRDGTTAVLDETSDVSLLDQAKELWKKGLLENEKGNYQKAIEYFSESKRYVAAYKALAVKSVYTVQLIPERRDCLWRISEYDFVYANPYLWPKIWRRNRKLIQNPDLIYPGWLLIIPPED